MVDKKEGIEFMDAIKQSLMEMAKAKGICSKGFAEMASMERDSLVRYYLANPDWCMERDFPTLSVLAESFSDREKDGVYVNKSFDGELLNELEVYTLHNCSGNIKVGLNIDKGIIPMIYLANNCRISISGESVGEQEKTIVPVYIFGRNDVELVEDEHLSFRIYEYELKA